MQWYWQAKTKNKLKNLSHCHFIQHKGHKDCDQIWASIVRGQELPPSSHGPIHSMYVASTPVSFPQPSFKSQHRTAVLTKGFLNPSKHMPIYITFNTGHNPFKFTVPLNSCNKLQLYDIHQLAYGFPLHYPKNKMTTAKKKKSTAKTKIQKAYYN